MRFFVPSMMLGLVVLSCVGCGSSDGTFPVSGTTSLSSGESFSGGKVQFLSRAGKSHSVALKPDGSFQLRKSSKLVGLEPGEYKVLVIEANFDDFDRPPVRTIHPKYGNAKTTDLTATVKEEPNVFEFTLEPFEGR